MTVFPPVPQSFPASGSAVEHLNKSRPVLVYAPAKLAAAIATAGPQLTNRLLMQFLGITGHLSHLVDALNLPPVSRQEGLQGFQIVAFHQQVLGLRVADRQLGIAF